MLVLSGRGLQSLPCGIQQLLHAKLYATEAGTGQSTSQRYPFPPHRNPSPHEIFHLQQGCKQADVKARYYELVRIYHPDSPSSRSISPEIRHKRFQSISAAYDSLRGKSPFTSSSAAGLNDYEHEIRRRKEAFYAAASARGNWDDATYSYGYDGHGPGSRGWNPPTTEDLWKDRTIIWGSAFLAILTFVPFIYHSPLSARRKMHQEARENYANARSDAKAHAKEKRVAIRKRIREKELERLEERYQREGPIPEDGEH